MEQNDVIIRKENPDTFVSKSDNDTDEETKDDGNTQASKLWRKALVSMKKAWRECTANTTLHGIKYVYDSERIIIRRLYRLFWLAAIAVVMYGLSLFGSQQTSRYLARHPLSTESVSYKDTLKFPAVTICSFNYIRNDSVSEEFTRDLMMHVFIYKSDYKMLEQRFGEDDMPYVRLSEY